MRKVTCPACRKDHQVNLNHCPHCQTAVTDELKDVRRELMAQDDEERAAKASRSNANAKGCLMVVGGLIALFIVIQVVSPSKNVSNAPATVETSDEFGTGFSDPEKTYARSLQNLQRFQVELKELPSNAPEYQRLDAMLRVAVTTTEVCVSKGRAAGGDYNCDRESKLRDQIEERADRAARKHFAQYRSCIENNAAESNDDQRFQTMSSHAIQSYVEGCGAR